MFTLQHSRWIKYHLIENVTITVIGFWVILFGLSKELEKEVAGSISDVVIDPDNPEVPKSTEVYEPQETFKEQSGKSFKLSIKYYIYTLHSVKSIWIWKLTLNDEPDEKYLQVVTSFGQEGVTEVWWTLAVESSRICHWNQ